MGFDLQNERGDDFRFGLVGWYKVLELAKMGGWEPAGTERPDWWDIEELAGPADELPEWSGGYTSNDGQEVNARDAAALGEALKAMLDFLPYQTDPDLMVNYAEAGINEGVPGQIRAIIEGLGLGDLEGLKGPNPNLDPLQFFGGESREKIRSFIGYCQRGSFLIW